MPINRRSRLAALARGRGILTAREVREAGIHSQEVTRLVRAGRLLRTAPGQYRLPARMVTERHALAAAAAASRRGVVCLLSALDFHGIGTQLPADTWLALPRGARAPVPRGAPYRIVHFSGEAYRHGIEVHRIEGVPVRVYGVAKTLADLFKYRNKLGIEVAVEALREAWVDRRFTVEQLDRAAAACRVGRVIRPYLEAVLG